MNKTVGRAGAGSTGGRAPISPRTWTRAGNNGLVRRQVSAFSASRELLSAGKVKFESGDRMGALRLWEQIPSKGPTQQERVTAAYNQTCVHASFGDLELAQITLRDAVLEGLDFKRMLEDPEAFDEDAVRLRASQQVMIRLRKFAEAAIKAAEERKAGAATVQKKEKLRALGVDTDLSEALSTDMTGIDTSILGIVRRVLLLLVALSVGGVGLWFVGLKYLL
jgi:hypothetical protein|mmetsp:Transcript_4973/g.14404  ORF Transcript_4973/g.14404 Transcript_4973/m.14404 type:complete len:222 (+) Transcript_4973:46-711(+)|eukprot:CAMPEP_0182615276 /NCGR_PEP_ID=MMETSP1330-20130603/34064_1 /TAXON_ID=464278 /ORGANISM="Picochlorum sp., Strain RCC944" /LENGTH=221 /DNA_ID=CAMNT_0024835189 /DNA_START=1 /DNA_END=666 /DNA_ORIENTATION=+